MKLLGIIDSLGDINIAVNSVKIKKTTKKLNIKSGYAIISLGSDKTIVNVIANRNESGYAYINGYERTRDNEWLVHLNINVDYDYTFVVFYF